MTPTRRFWALPALALTLVLGACSTPDDLNAPVLEPQFGTADEDIGARVVTVSTGRVYSLSEQYGPFYNLYGDEDGVYEKALLRRYDGSGKLIWTKEITSSVCTYSSDCYRDSLSLRSLATNSQGYIYALVSDSYVFDDSYTLIDYTLRKFDSSGNPVDSVDIGTNGYGFGYEGTEFADSVGIAVDGTGNAYIARINYDLTYDTNEPSGSYGNIVAKYAPSGSLLWQRISTVGKPYDITVSSTGSIYVVGDKGLARYSNSGTLSWTKPGNFEEVVISGSNIYTRYRRDIFKFDGNGKQLWKRAQSGLTSPSFADMKGDGNGNVYLAGKYNASSTNRDAFIRKLNSSGSVLWTRSYGTGAYDDALGIATINGSEIYTTGSTQGTLSHTNIGGSDGYLRKTNSSGTLVWTR